MLQLTKNPARSITTVIESKHMVTEIPVLLQQHREKVQRKKNSIETSNKYLVKISWCLSLFTTEHIFQLF